MWDVPVLGKEGDNDEPSVYMAEAAYTGKVGPARGEPLPRSSSEPRLDGLPEAVTAATAAAVATATAAAAAVAARGPFYASAAAAAILAAVTTAPLVAAASEAGSVETPRGEADGPAAAAFARSEPSRSMMLDLPPLNAAFP